MARTHPAMTRLCKPNGSIVYRLNRLSAQSPIGPIVCSHALGVTPVAMLEFLPGTAGTSLVAADFAPGGGIFRIALGWHGALRSLRGRGADAAADAVARQRFGARHGERHLVF